MVTYSESGVDIDLEAVTVSKLADKLKSTLECRDIITDSGHYAALVKLGEKAIAMSTDGVGSKILIAKMMDKYDTVGIDCIAMVVNDILCVGAEPIALVDYLAVEEPDPEIAEKIAKKPKEAIKLIKKGVREIGFKSTDECFYKNLEYSKAIFKTNDCKEGVDAFLSKRAPKFS